MSVPEYFEKKLEITKLFCFLSCRMRGTHAAVGVATRTAPIHVHGYKSLIGNLMIRVGKSGGWDIMSTCMSEYS